MTKTAAVNSCLGLVALLGGLAAPLSAQDEGALVATSTSSTTSGDFDRDSINIDQGGVTTSSGFCIGSPGFCDDKGTPVPEPSGMFLFGAAATGVLLRRRRKSADSKASSSV
ncbi:MAG: PEP-CTERM sorting domain-containing protein [Pseudomonadota bacterium]